MIWSIKLLGYFALVIANQGHCQVLECLDNDFLFFLECILFGSSNRQEIFF